MCGFELDEDVKVLEEDRSFKLGLGEEEYPDVGESLLVYKFADEDERNKPSSEKIHELGTSLQHLPEKLTLRMMVVM